MDRLYDIIIIGGGPGGYTAALYGARAGLDTLVIEKLSPGGQMALTGDIENYPGFDEGIDGFSLGMKLQNGAHKIGAATVYADVLSQSLDSTPKRIVTDSGEYLAKAVIIATGADPRPLGLEEESALVGKGVHYCARCDARFYKDKTVAIVGGGNSAVSDALYLSRLAKKVYLIHRRDTLRASKTYHSAVRSAENIHFIKSSSVEKILSDGRVSGIRIKHLKDGSEEELAVNGLFISIGRVPSTAFLKGEPALDESGYIIADETTKTSIDGVFAVGDVRTKALRQIVTAAADGAVAAHFAEEYLQDHK